MADDGVDSDEPLLTAEQKRLADLAHLVGIRGQKTLPFARGLQRVLTRKTRAPQLVSASTARNPLLGLVEKISRLERHPSMLEWSPAADLLQHQFLLLELADVPSPERKPQKSRGPVSEAEAAAVARRARSRRTAAMTYLQGDRQGEEIEKICACLEILREMAEKAATEAKRLPKQGRRKNDARLFAEELVSLIFRYGGRASLDKRTETGTIVDLMDALTSGYPSLPKLTDAMLSTFRRAIDEAGATRKPRPKR